MKPHPLLLLTTLFAVGTTPLLAQPIWTAGHGDIGIGYIDEDGAGPGTNFVLEPHWHLGEDGEVVVVDGVPISDLSGFEYAPGGLIARTGLSATRASGLLWEPIGVASGETFYLFPNPENPTTAYVGVGAEDLNPSDWNDGAVFLTLTGIAGSGVTAGGIFSFYELDGFGDPTFFMSTENGIDGTDVFTVIAGSHEHYNFAFSQIGIYDITFLVSGVHNVDGAKSTSATYTFEVVPEPGSLALFLLGSSALLLKRRRASAA